ncbi:hypothetical protein BaRGS_00010077 [Batillaria attramentaria]|uniref:Tudor domain-containing protein n=1 Tax=Batillaria attramentaria TaxID=370345 RepID=A0ABD0LH31_9CAEN
MFLTQAYHTHVQRMCADYLWYHRDEDISCIIEMVALSRIYKLEFYVYHTPGMPPLNVTDSGNIHEVLLVCSENAHYDLVHSRTYIQDLAVCQSVLYEMLYKRVFKLDTEVEEAVNFIRLQKKTNREYTGSPDGVDCNGRTVSPHDISQKCLGAGAEKELCCQLQQVTERAIPPLPYRIAKALDPAVYRNVELDIVQEEKRELRLKLQSQGLYKVFSPGDKCEVQLEQDSDTVYHAHVQEISEPNGQVVVFIVELGEKRTVPLSSLRPLALPVNKNDQDLAGLPIAEIATLTFSTGKRGRRRKVSGVMPGAAEFQPPNNTVRSPRIPTGRRLPEPPLGAVSGPPTAVDCMGMVEGVDTGAGLGYCMVTSSMPMVSANQMAPLASSPGTGAGPGVVYTVPAIVPVPYVNSIGQINPTWAPSQDPNGKDLPFSDINTLRYFFNLGLEYYRIMSSMHQQQQIPYSPSSPLPQMMPNGMPASHMIALEQGQSFTSPDPPRHESKSTISTQRTHSAGKHTPGKSSARDKSAGQEGGSKGENMELSSDMSDSGCASCGEGGLGGEEDADQQMELASSRTDEDAGSTQGEEVSEKSVRVKGKRKYYMYGPHKLIKPIKDIPPRFQMMLAENSAAKARCEGQPIYMQMSPTDMAIFEQDDGSSGLNADAQCFYPTQPYETVMVEDTGMCTYGSTAVAYSTPSTQPPPMLVPPPPIVQPGSGQGPVGVVYSCTPHSSAPILAQSIYTRPLPTTSVPAPRPGDGKAASVGSNTSSVNPCTTGKGPANSAGEKWQEEFARPASASARLHGKGADMSSTQHASVSGLPAMSQAPPFPASSSMPPPPSVPPMRVGAAPNSSSCAGGGKQCFYVYPSHSAGYTSMPTTPSQGQGPTHNLNPGQVVYVMNPQGYPGPPCTAYQPTMMATPTHMPCPPVAVQ